MKISVVKYSGGAAGEFEVADALLIKDGKGTQAVHDTVTAHMANRRQGTSKVKQISDVHGSGKKPWKQKGTGRARAGSFASPLWRGGGVVFGPHLRDYTIKVPKKVKALAFRKVFSERLIAGDFVVLDELKLANPKTKEFAVAIRKLVANSAATLVVADQVDNNLKLASRNLTDVQVEQADSVSVYELLRYDKFVATRAALEKLTARIGK